MLLALKDAPAIKFCICHSNRKSVWLLFKHTINYDKIKKKLSNFYTTTWLIFAGPVTF